MPKNLALFPWTFISIPEYVSDEEEFQEKLWFIKASLCPYCQTSGNLVLHGFLTGYGIDDEPEDKRGRRIFCSNRGKHFGCGRTFSILFSDCLKNFSIRATELWSALKNIATGKPIYQAIKLTSRFSQSYPYHLWRTFKLNLSHIRSFLGKKRGPPDCLPASCPYISTIFELEERYQGTKCPVSTFQESNNAPFFRG